MTRLILIIFILAINLLGKNECADKSFSRLTMPRGATISSALEQISGRCGINVVLKDEASTEMIDKKIGTLNLKNFSLIKALDTVIAENNLFYELDEDILRISSVGTKTWQIDYVATSRSSSSGIHTSVTSQNSQTTNSAAQQDGEQNSVVGTNITTSDSFDFYKELENELRAIIKREQVSQNSVTESTTTDKSSRKTTKSKSVLSGGVIINKNANLVTVTGTKDELDRVDKYLTRLTDRLHRQVLIDVNIFSVSLDDTRTTGIDWSNIFNFLNASVSIDGIKMKNVSTFGETGITALDGTLGISNGGFLRLSSSVNLKDIVKFLNTQGNVKSISNPKVLTLNNQPALIFSGETIYYPVVSGGTSSTATTGATNPSVVATALPVGVTLDITPEIIDQNSAILKINPSSSQCISANCALQRVSIGGASYDIAPNISQKQLSSVIKVKNGEKIILGGLIRDKNEQKSTKIPILGDIPIAGYLFKQDIDAKTMEELVVIITPHILGNEQIVDKEKLGFSSDKR